MNNDAARFGRQYKTYAVLFERKITSIFVSPTIKTVWCKARKMYLKIHHLQTVNMFSTSQGVYTAHTKE